MKKLTMLSLLMMSVFMYADVPQELHYELSYAEDNYDNAEANDLELPVFFSCPDRNLAGHGFYLNTDDVSMFSIEQVLIPVINSAYGVDFSQYDLVVDESDDIVKVTAVERN